MTGYRNPGPPIDLVYMAKSGFWSKVDVQEDETRCWKWLMSAASHGYGQTWDGITVRLAHRVAWELTNGPLPEGMTVDHGCRVRMCCNPSHLRMMTNVENATDNGQGRKTHCPSGHEYAGANLYVSPWIDMHDLPPNQKEDDHE